MSRLKCVFLKKNPTKLTLMNSSRHETFYFRYSSAEIGMSRSMRESRKSRRSNIDNVFLVDKGREDPNTTFSEPSPVRLRSAIEMAFRWRADDGPTLNAGLMAL